MTFDTSPTPFVICDQNGQIIRRGSVPAFAVAAQANAEWGETAVLGTGSFDTHWVDMTDPDNPTLMEKTVAPITVNGKIASNIPIPATVVVEKVAYPWSDSTLELEFEIPGTYDVVIKTLRHLPFVFSVTETP